MLLARVPETSPLYDRRQIGGTGKHGLQECILHTVGHDYPLSAKVDAKLPRRVP
jgi:hypothetical protein